MEEKTRESYKKNIVEICDPNENSDFCPICNGQFVDGPEWDEIAYNHGTDCGCDLQDIKDHYGF